MRPASFQCPARADLVALVPVDSGSQGTIVMQVTSILVKPAALFARFAEDRAFEFARSTAEVQGLDLNGLGLGPGLQKT